MIYRIFVEKKQGLQSGASIKKELSEVLGINTDVRQLIRYDFQGERADFDKAIPVVFSEPPLDDYYLEEVDLEGHVLCVELLPGQFDQRANSAAECIMMLTGSTRPIIRCATVYAFSGINEKEFSRIKQYLINPIEARECGCEKYASLKEDHPAPMPETTIAGFISFDDNRLKEFYKNNSFAFSFDDLKFIQAYFVKEGRDPFSAELKVLDTYWSDHCRHTTFNTRLEKINISSDIQEIKNAYNTYQDLFKKHYADRKDKYQSLMDMAVIGAKELKSKGLLKNMDESEEINACSIKIEADISGKKQNYTVMFKNETHNHPTEIEPYGGAATCLGGAIRDPLSGRVYVYQSMRVTGAADINQPLNQTIKGKLPQRTISTKAAAGFSSYGNQIGLATGSVHEFYHKGYTAKRLEAGFVVGAAPSENIVRQKPTAGDIVLLIGGETGRDGLGGATGSSKAHGTDSLTECGAEVQKGNPTTERKLQRLFRNPEFAKIIKRCNDFGAGGVSVAIGELSDGLDIDLDSVPKKYAGLSGTELALSESQERMAVVIERSNLDKVVKMAAQENLNTSVVASVTDSGRMRMRFNGQLIVDLSREFLDTSGVMGRAACEIVDKNAAAYLSDLSDNNQTYFDNKDYETLLKNLLSVPNAASQKGMIEIFDSTIGAGTVLMPLAGKNQLSPEGAMVAKLPVPVDKDTTTATVAAYGFDPYLSEISPFTGAVYAVTSSVIKAVTAGADYDSIYLTFQEYFEKLKTDPVRWGKPVSALLGALHAQLKLDKAAIGGKDSMSGSFEDIDVPPTLISFSLGVANAGQVVSSAATETDIDVYRYKIKRDKYGLPDFKSLREFLSLYQQQVRDKSISFATTVSAEGAAIALIKSLFGNSLGFKFEVCDKSLFTAGIGDIVFGLKQDKSADNIALLCEKIGQVTADKSVRIGGKTVQLDALKAAFTGTFEAVYPTTAPASGEAKIKDYYGGSIITRHKPIASPRVFIPAFPGTNCEYDSAKAFVKAGAKADIFVVKNQTVRDISESAEIIKKHIDSANILMIPGGFSGGDEPDGSGKFICALLQNPYIAESINNLLYKRDGLILGICNGFQALIKLGLLPYGKLSPQNADSPTLTYNTIKRHVSQIVKVRVASNLSPWLSFVKPGEVYNQAVSHGEGRFIAPVLHLNALAAAGQIATQYADNEGKPTMISPFNPNGSAFATEGLLSPDGRVFGKMGHSERIGDNICKNIDNTPFNMRLFESGVDYYK